MINGVSLAPLSVLVPTPRGSLLDVSPGARAAHGGGRVQGRCRYKHRTRFILWSVSPCV